MADKEIKVYSTSTCPWCRKAKEYFSGKGVKYTEYDVSQDREKLQEMVDLTGQRGVPVIVINNQVIVGFNQAKIDEALAA
ncbi:MAG TPA: NrdH-redoxin [Armatimonadetes bacterium]|jgi:glutaredoxin 3|nr:NrdH-redoxin [Armatimonadota bacterium]